MSFSLILSTIRAVSAVQLTIGAIGTKFSESLHTQLTLQDSMSKMPIRAPDFKVPYANWRSASSVFQFRFARSALGSASASSIFTKTYKVPIFKFQCWAACTWKVICKFQQNAQLRLTVLESEEWIEFGSFSVGNWEWMYGHLLDCCSTSFDDYKITLRKSKWGKVQANGNRWTTINDDKFNATCSCASFSTLARRHTLVGELW